MFLHIDILGHVNSCIYCTFFLLCSCSNCCYSCFIRLLLLISFTVFIKPLHVETNWYILLLIYIIYNYTYIMHNGTNWWGPRFVSRMSGKSHVITVTLPPGDALPPSKCRGKVVARVPKAQGVIRAEQGSQRLQAGHEWSLDPRLLSNWQHGQPGKGV